MKTFALNIQLGNAAMQTPTDLAGALRELADKMDDGTAGDPFTPIKMKKTTRINGVNYDVNGERVGHWFITKSP